MSNNWWANKLGAPQQPQQTVWDAPSAPPVQRPAVPYVSPELQGRAMPESAAASSRCPNCGSGNYGKTSPEAKARCYDCGYPIQQSGSGLGRGISTGGGGGAVVPAKQVSTSNNFNPGVIIDRIG